MSRLLFFFSLFILSNPAWSATTHKINLEESSLQWEGRKVGGAHRGTIALKSGTLNFREKTLVGGEFTIDMTAIANQDIDDPKYKAKLESHLKSDDFFSVDKYPVSRFVITKVAPPHNNDGVLITGKLHLKGLTQTISFPAEISFDQERATANAKIEIDRTKFNIRFRSASFFEGLGDKVIKDKFTVTIKLLTRRASAAGTRPKTTHK